MFLLKKRISGAYVCNNVLTLNSNFFVERINAEVLTAISANFLCAEIEF